MGRLYVELRLQGSPQKAEKSYLLALGLAIQSRRAPGEPPGHGGGVDFEQPSCVGGSFLAGADHVNDFVLLARDELEAVSADAALLSGRYQSIAGTLAAFFGSVRGCSPIPPSRRH